MSNKKAPKKKLSEGTQALIICLSAVALIVIALVAVLVVSTQDNSPKPVNMVAVQAEINSKSTYDFDETTEVTEYVRLTVKDKGDIVIRLRSDIAPLTVQNFQTLVKTASTTG